MNSPKEASLALARKGFDFFGLEGTFVHGDGETLPFDDASFDVVYSWGVIHHSLDPPAVAREIHRVLRPGGQILAMVYHARGRRMRDRPISIVADAATVLTVFRDWFQRQLLLKGILNGSWEQP